MEIRVLRYFLTVAREETISRAADILHITQPTLSRQLSQMEEDMGVRLFERGPRKISSPPRAASCAAAPRRSSSWWARQRTRSAIRTRPFPASSPSAAAIWAPYSAS